MASFFAELKRRNVFKVVVACAIVVWLQIEFVAITFLLPEFPQWTTQFITVIILIGSSLAMLLACAIELTPQGVKLAATVDPASDDSLLSGWRLDNWRTTGNWEDFCRPIGKDDFECEYILSQ